MDSKSVEDKVGHLHGWLEDLIDKFRQEAQQQLTEVQIARVGWSGNYLAPCQIEIIWIAEPEFQIVVVSNFLDRKDKEIVINGPFEGHELIDAIDSLLKEPRWTKPLPVAKGQAPLLPYPVVEFTTQPTLAEVLSGVLYGDLETIKDSFLQRVKRPAEFGGFRLCDEAFVWLIAGKISDLPKDKIIGDFIRQAKFEPSTLQSTPIPTLPQVRCLATYVYPPIRIGVPPKPTNFGEFFSGVYMYRFGQKAFETKFDNYRIIITKDGLIAITVDNRELALRIFNVIFGTAELCGVPAQAVRESEIGAITFDEATMTTMTYSMPMRTLRSMPILERRGQRLSFMSLRRVVTEDTFSEIIGKAERIYQHLDKSDELSFFLQALTHLEDTEFAQSFTMSWILVEKYLSQIWENFMREKKVYGERENKLTNPGMWSMDFVIETLNLGGVLSEQRYKLLMELKGKRNSFIHKGRAITKDDAEECLKMAKEIVLHDLEGLI